MLPDTHELFASIADFREALVGEFLRAAENFESGDDAALQAIPVADRARAAAAARNVAQFVAAFGLR